MKDEVPKYRICIFHRRLLVYSEYFVIQSNIIQHMDLPKNVLTKEGWCGGGDKGKLAKTFIKDVGNSVCQMKGKISKGNK